MIVGLCLLIVADSFWALLLASVFAAVAAIWILPLRGKIENGKRPPAAQVET